MNELIPVAVSEKNSEKSVEKMLSIATKENMGKLTVEIAAIADSGRLLCESTYLMEGDDPLVFGTHLHLVKLKHYITTGPRFSIGSTTQKRCKEAAHLVNDLCKDSINNKNMLTE